MKRFIALFLLLAYLPATGWAIDQQLAFEDPAWQSRYEELNAGLRCLVCQNQTIADSNASLAVDLRGQVKEMMIAGKTDKEILDYMVARYGNFVRFQPPVNNETIFLWAAPAVMVLGGLLIALSIVRRRSNLPVGDEDETPVGGDA
ncbi:MAG: cytochrome c-type biogenesis protein CcmH [Gammaproteobacteria bacterium]|jgi:cytochrome c-type biogenesis protein CcmH|nr:cytochrome c-type biogenesis protein CcmH [Gammaproteobacteria bacterium]